MCIAFILYMERGKIMSKLFKYPIGINNIDRSSNHIEDINWNWERYPKNNKISATQIWINLDSIQNKRYYAKKIFMVNGLIDQAYEEDRYLISFEDNKQTDLVIRYSFEDNKLKNRISWIEKIDKIDLNENCYDWFKESFKIKELSISESDSLKMNFKSEK